MPLWRNTQAVLHCKKSKKLVIKCHQNVFTSENSLKFCELRHKNDLEFNSLQKKYTAKSKIAKAFTGKSHVSHNLIIV